MLDNELKTVRISGKELGALCFVLTWLRQRMQGKTTLGDERLPKALSESEAFASRAISDAKSRQK